MKVMFVVTHLLGTGHLSRVMTLARAFQAAGHQPIVVSGGMPADHLGDDRIPLVQLPPLRSDGTDFTRLLDVDGNVAGDALLDQRRAMLLNTLQDLGPDALITELFPFGRRSLRTEFRALLETAHAQPLRPRIFASIRDILAPPSKPAKAVFAEDLVQEFYDGVLVHSDAQVVPLDLSWPISETLRHSLRYTGFVATAREGSATSTDGAHEIIVSAGGGDTGTALFDCARGAAALDGAHRWRLLIGGRTAPDRIARLRQNAPSNMSAEALRPDFRQMLHRAAASVSMCGYNSAQDILQTSCPAVFVPFDDGNEVEQTIRAQALSKVSGIEVLKSEDLSPGTLLDRVQRAITAPRRPARDPANGAANTVEIVRDMLEGIDAD